MDGSFSVDEAVQSSTLDAVADKRGCVMLMETPRGHSCIYLHYKDRESLARFARLLCTLSGVELAALPAEMSVDEELGRVERNSSVPQPLRDAINAFSGGCDV